MIFVIQLISSKRKVHGYMCLLETSKKSQINNHTVLLKFLGQQL